MRSKVCCGRPRRHRLMGDAIGSFTGRAFVDAAAAVKYVQTRNAATRAIALLALVGMIVVLVKRKKGTLASPLAWAGPAIFTSVGLFFLPWFVPRVFPRRGRCKCGRSATGACCLVWGSTGGMPFANALVVLGLVAVGFGRKQWRAPIGGFALGTCAYLLAGAVTGFVAGPFGGVLRLAWLLANAGVCFWIARIALDRKTAEANT